MVDEGLLAGLNPAQQRAVVSEAAPLCILAGAGSGKTRVLTRRIAWRVGQGRALAPHVLALTFTRRAASELGVRLAQLGVREQVAAGTFHAVAYGQLRRLWADRDERPPALLDRKVRLLAGLLPRPAGARVQPADIATEIEWAKARMVSPAAYEAAATAAGRRPSIPAAAVAALYERYEQEKARRHLVDFDDLLLLCATSLETDRTFGAAQRWRFRHLFVDEFQDVNPLQFRLLEGWRGDRSDLCVVGDPNQAIYAWNGADPKYLTEFRLRFPSAEVVHLDDNYRSSPQILAVANAVLDSSATATGDEHAPHRLRAHQSPGPPPTVHDWPTDREEAVEIARALRRRAGTTPWSHMAVLTRTHAQLLVFEEALRAARVPYRLRGDGAFLDQPEVRSALAELRRRPADTLLAAVLPDLREMAEDAEPESAATERRGHLEGLHRMAREHLATDPAASLSGFMGWLRAALRGDDAVDSTNAVALTTFHAAKGLEWDVVFLAGLEHGLLPISWAEAPEARAEERRLLYVAVTRARVELHASWARKRAFGARTLGRQPSPYLEAIEAAVRDLAEGGTGDSWRRWVDEGRARLRDAHDARPVMAGAKADPAVLDALKTWRARTARATGVPAFVVFHDTTLAAVAEAQPRNHTALLALPGVGPVKAGRYGDAVLEVVAASRTGG
ncbi:MAG: ATP-dependent helicase UvrD/PcrA [Actinomycetota bacterium]|jgi:DNA helicase-2/ATP-dependent DNA helicase PcrA|nr:ATP-dependent helicase UvrD/PcrA [Actinomycetota bacterium]